MHDRNSDTIFLFGDSITSLFMHEMKSLAKRESFDMLSTEVDDGNFPGYYTVEISVPKELVPDSSSPPSWKILFIDIASVNNVNGFDADKYKKLIDTLLAVSKGKALFIINAGLHFQISGHSDSFAERLASQKEAYRHLMRDLFFPMFVAYAKDGHTVVFRETSATHFPTPSGLMDIRCVFTFALFKRTLYIPQLIIIEFQCCDAREACTNIVSSLCFVT